MKYYQLLFILFLGFSSLQAQQISGYVYGDDKLPVPYANIYIQQLQTGTSTDEEGYYFLALDEGEYNLIFSALGYKSKEVKLFVGADGVKRSVVLKASNLELEEITVKALKKDSAYLIIQNAVENKKKFLQQVGSYRTEVYVKSTEEVEKHETKKEEKKSVIEVETAPEADPFEAEAVARKSNMPNINLLEMELTLNYQYPNKYKEERTAYKAYGSKAGLYVPRFGQTDFNFYRNLVFPQDIVESPIISPISRTAILSYKYKLIESKTENGVLVYKIKVMPRKSGNSTVEGYIYINDGIWNINRLDFDFQKGGMKFYDEFNIQQIYTQVEDSLWIPTRQEYQYETNQGKKQTFKGNTVIHYKNYERDYTFPDKFFGNEIAVTTKEAYERDSTYWQNTRIEPLSADQQKMITIRDSIEAVYNSPEYKDSIDQAYNKVSVLEVLWDGVGFRDHRKGHQLNLGSLPSLIDFEVVGGFRINPYVSYFKKWDNEKRLYTSASASVGIKNKDVQGNLYGWYYYNPNRLSSVSFDVGRSFQSINPYDAYINQLRISNYILHDKLVVRHRMELLNGLYWNVNFAYSDRKSIDGFDATSFLNGFIDETEAIQFEPYQALISDIFLSYTPAQQYMTEPNRKVVLGSKYPTFTIKHKKGWNNTFGSDIDFDYVEASISQDLQLGTLGNSNYRVEVGKFVNTKDLRFIDLKRFRESDPILYSNPLHSFQLLDTALATSKVFLEVHHIHHFNGALVNNIPLVKKLRIRAVAGGGILWVQENNFRYQEVFAGIERVFKLGVRRRLRLGVYGVFADSSSGSPQSSFKVSFDVIDTWKRNWDF